MKYLEIIFSSLFSLAVLFILTKLMGKKQVAELTVFDYIIGISIGSIAAETATDLENPIKGLLAMAVYAVAAFAISLLTQKFLKLRRLIFGKSTFIIKDGRLLRGNMKKARLDLGEFLMGCRTAGYFNISDIAYAVLEPNGKISILPFADKAPATPALLNVAVKNSSLAYSVIADGVILYENLKALGLNEAWLNSALKQQGYKSSDEVFLATADKNAVLSVFPISGKIIKNDPFE